MLNIAGREFASRLFIGTGKFAHPELLKNAAQASGSQMATMALKRLHISTENTAAANNDDILTPLKQLNIHLLPNTSGAANAKEAIYAAELAREALQTNWVKLEIHPDPRYLMPDGNETFIAAKKLCELGFIVLPYVHADPVLCKKLEEVGCAAVMPLGAPIGSNRGLLTEDFLRIIIEQANIPVVVDAGIGAPSHAAYAMELGADAVLVNSAIAVSAKPAEMAKAFAQAVEAGRCAYEAGLAEVGMQAQASSPLTEFLQQLNEVE